jgi:hypothetical protein
MTQLKRFEKYKKLIINFTMGLFGKFFKKSSEFVKNNSDNGVFGPTYLEKYSAKIEDPNNLKSYEWRRIISNNGQTKFKIRYFGQLHSSYKNLIVDTEFSKPLLVAVDVSNNQEVLLWDGCKHGYDPIFCKDFTEEQIKNRKAETFYIDNDGKDEFEIYISTYYQIDFDEEFEEEVDRNGFLKLENGAKIKFDEVKRNGFDCLIINVKNINGKVTEIVSAELA